MRIKVKAHCRRVEDAGVGLHHLRQISSHRNISLYSLISTKFDGLDGHGFGQPIPKNLTGEAREKARKLKAAQAKFRKGRKIIHKDIDDALKNHKAYKRLNSDHKIPSREEIYKKMIRGQKVIEPKSRTVINPPNRTNTTEKNPKKPGWKRRRECEKIKPSIGKAKGLKRKARRIIHSL